MKERERKEETAAVDWRKKKKKNEQSCYDVMPEDREAGWTGSRGYLGLGVYMLTVTLDFSHDRFLFTTLA